MFACAFGDPFCFYGIVDFPYSPFVDVYDWSYGPVWFSNLRPLFVLVSATSPLSSVVIVYYYCFRQCVGIEPIMETSPVHDFGYQGLLAYYGALWRFVSYHRILAFTDWSRGGVIRPGVWNRWSCERLSISHVTVYVGFSHSLNELSFYSISWVRACDILGSEANVIFGFDATRTTAGPLLCFVKYIFSFVWSKV